MRGDMISLSGKMFKFKEDDDPLIKVTAVHDQDQCQIGFQPSNATVLSIICSVMLQ